jgi:hypothetical protein
LKPAAISQSDFFEWNPALDASLTMLPAGYRIKLPPEKLDDFLAAERRFVTPPSKPQTMVTPKARPVSWKSVNKNRGAGKRSVAAAGKNSEASKNKLSHAARAPVRLAAQ